MRKCVSSVVTLPKHSVGPLISFPLISRHTSVGKMFQCVEYMYVGVLNPSFPVIVCAWVMLFYRAVEVCHVCAAAT
jgi:hypothetical protein